MAVEHDLPLRGANPGAETVNGLAADGLNVGVDVTVLFHPISVKAGLLHKEVGPDYASRLVRPVTVEAVRDIIGKYSPHDLYRRRVMSLEQQILGANSELPLLVSSTTRASWSETLFFRKI